MNSKQYFENILKLVNNPKQREFYEWLIENGVHFEMKGSKVDSTMYHGSKPRGGACFYNSQLLAIEYPTLVKYYEGVAISKLGIPLDHAFVVMDGKVHDPTWADGQDYFGVHIPTKFIRKIWLQEEYARAMIPFYYMEVVDGK